MQGLRLRAWDLTHVFFVLDPQFGQLDIHSPTYSHSLQQARKKAYRVQGWATEVHEVEVEE